MQTRSEHETRRWKVYQISFSQNKKKVKKRKVYEKKCCTTFPSSFSLHNFCTKTNFSLKLSAQHSSKRGETKGRNLITEEEIVNVKLSFFLKMTTQHTFATTSDLLCLPLTMQRAELNAPLATGGWAPKEIENFLFYRTHFSLERFRVVAVCVVCSVIIV